MFAILLSLFNLDALSVFQKPNYVIPSRYLLKKKSADIHLLAQQSLLKRTPLATKEKYYLDLVASNSVHDICTYEILMAIYNHTKKGKKMKG